MDDQSIKIISIEGNIGSGKSTLVEQLKTILLGRKDICFLDEPIDLWNSIMDIDGKTIIEKYYENQERYAFAFQMMAYISRISVLKKALKNKETKIIITERCVFTDYHVFAKMLYDDKKIDLIEYSIYQKWFHDFLEEIPETNIIYVKTAPETAYERVLKRNRTGESIPIDYLSMCNTYHNNWLSNSSYNMLELDGNEDIIENSNILNDWIFKIIEFIENVF